MMKLPGHLVVVVLFGCLMAGVVVHTFELPSSLSKMDVVGRQHQVRLFMNNKRRKGSSSRTSKGFGGGGGAATTKGGEEQQEGPSWARSFQFAGDVRPGVQTPQKIVREKGVVLPDYALDGTPKTGKPMLPWVIEVKTPEQIEKMRASGRLARHVLDMAGRMVKPGITTNEIDDAVHRETIKNGAYPSPLNYHGFPKSCCTSVNEVICHGIPDNRQLKEGDVVNVDITVYLDGFHGDCSEMFVVGDNPSPEVKNLLQTTYDCWILACNFVKPGRDYKDIGVIIEDYIVRRGFSTVRNFCGHGIGSVFHTNPNILHYKNQEPNGQMSPGHTFTIEPMICEGSSRALSWPDQWTATTIDGKRSAQFEHTLLITKDGVEALTGKTEDSPLQFWERESQIHQGIWLGTSAGAQIRQAEINSNQHKLV